MKLSKRIISILLTLCFITSGMIFANAQGEAQASEVWDGTADKTWYNPTDTVFHIGTAEELAGLAKLVNDGTEDFAGKTIMLDADIVLYSGNAEDWDETTGPINMKDIAAVDATYTYGWNPIGHYENIETKYIDSNNNVISESPAFKGTFDGNGHSVSGIYYARGSAQVSVGIGLFGFVQGATIKRLYVKNSFLRANSAIGGIVGWARDGGVTISDCYSDATISIYGRKSYDKAHIGYGGILGRADVGAVNISGCWFNGKTYHTPDGSNNRFANGVGGIVGYLKVNGNKVNNCLVTGTVEGNINVGGIVGRCDMIENGSIVEINNTVMFGTVIAENTSYNNAVGAEIIGLLANGATAFMSDVYGKADFAASVGSGASQNVWETDGSCTVEGWTQSQKAHRLSNDALKELVGVELAEGEWATFAGRDYPVPAYFAPAQFKGVQFGNIDADNYDARFVGTIDKELVKNYTMDGAKVGFEVVVRTKGNAEATRFYIDGATVYDTIIADGEEISVDGKYLIALTITDVPVAIDQYYVRTFVSDGTNTVFGKTVVVDRPENWND